MINYLKMNGLNSSLQTPSITANEYIFDIEVGDRNPDTIGCVFDHGYQWIRRQTTGVEQWSPNINSVYVDDLQVTNGTPFLTPNKRLTIRFSSNALTGIMYIFRNWSNLYFVEGKIYDIKILNNGVLVAHYDMSTRTVQDQSGNGNHATLTNGEWVQEEQINPEEDNESGAHENSTSYIIELEKWGINKVVPNKPYVYEDYVKADNNISGINNALQYAYDNGYSEVVLPRGEYAVCYPQTIQMKSGVTFNLNRSTLKVIYDSDIQSPLDKTDRSISQDPYMFGGNTITFNNVTNSHLVNGTLVGCKADRSFSNPKEVAVEWTYGAMLESSTRFCSVKYCKISDYMGDNISFNSTSAGTYAEFGMSLQLAKINPADGSLITSGVTNTLTTGIIPIINGWEQYGTIMLTGFGYARHTSINTKTFGVYFYSATDQYLGGYAVRKVYEDSAIPPKAKKFRLVFYHETNVSKDMQITVRYGGIPHHNIVEFNEITRGHRGGVTGGGSFNVIQHNVIIDNGLGLGKFLDGKPIFNDPTRYSINQEDSYGDNIVIRDNYISGSFHGILVGCHSVYIENNIINNIDYMAINLYSMQYASVRGNYMSNNQQNIGLMWSNYRNAHVDFIGNSTHGGNIKLDGSMGGYHVTISDNHIVNPTMILADNDGVFKNNTIQYTNRVGITNPTSVFKIPKVSGCTIEAKVVAGDSYVQSISLECPDVTYRDCTFNNIHVQIPSVVSSKKPKEYFVSCEFNGSTIRPTHFTNNFPTRDIFISDSKIVDTYLNPITVGISDKPRIFKLSSSTINLNSSAITEFVLSDISTSSSFASIELEDCEFEISYPMAQLQKSSSPFHNDTIALSLKRVNFLNTGVTPFSMKYYWDKKNIRKLISTENKLKNMSFITADDPSKFIGYDPAVYSIGEPNTGDYYFVGRVVRNANPTSGSYLGWVCITEGWANNIAWATSTSYVVGQQINVNNKIYKCTVSGTSGTVAPSHTSGTAIDKTVTWEYVGNKAIFKRYGLIEE